jgi:hypothetical protein
MRGMEPVAHDPRLICAASQLAISSRKSLCALKNDNR